MSASAETVARLYEAMAAGDLDSVLAVAAPDIVLEQDRALPWGGRFEGHDGVLEFATKLVSTIESQVGIEALFVAGDDVVQCGRTRGKVLANGATFDIPECHIWTFAGGQVQHVRFFIDTAAMLEALTQ